MEIIAEKKALSAVACVAMRNGSKGCKPPIVVNVIC